MPRIPRPSRPTVPVPALGLAALATAATLLAGCTAPAPSGGGLATGTTPASVAATASPTTVTVTDNHGTQQVTVPPARVVSTDNRTFETLQNWGITLAAAPKALIPLMNPYSADASIVDLGSHTAPKLEALVAAQPDLIINGRRFEPKLAEIKKLAPGAAVLDLEPREGQPLDAELKRQVTTLGQVFAKQAEAERLVADFDAAAARVEAAYDKKLTVMALNVSGGKLGYIAPSKGRVLGPVFDQFGLTPALNVANASDDHQGDDISVEAIATAKPDILLVLDRDAAIASAAATAKPAREVLAGSEALRSVPAVQTGRIVHLPADSYTNDGIQTYTEFYRSLADALEQP